MMMQVNDVDKKGLMAVGKVMASMLILMLTWKLVQDYALTVHRL